MCGIRIIDWMRKILMKLGLAALWEQPCIRVLWMHGTNGLHSHHVCCRSHELTISSWRKRRAILLLQLKLFYYHYHYYGSLKRNSICLEKQVYAWFPRCIRGFPIGSCFRAVAVFVCVWSVVLVVVALLLLHQEDKIHMFALCVNCWILINHTVRFEYEFICNVCGWFFPLRSFICLFTNASLCRDAICDYKTILRWQ